MKKAKKYLVFIMLVIIIITLTGCGDNSSNNNNNVSNSKNESSASNNKNNDNDNSEDNNKQTDISSIDFVSLAKEQMTMPNKGDTIAILHIRDYGDITVKFFSNVAPKAVENFTTHAKNGYYNGVTFHRVMEDFMIQGGDPTTTGTGGESIWNKDFEDEFSYDLVPYRGALCMANAGSDTNGSQFFIEQAEYDEETYNLLKQNNYPENLLEAYKIYGGSMHLFLAHTVFGQVIEGMDVVDKIAQVETDSRSKPVNDVVIESIEVTQY